MCREAGMPHNLGGPNGHVASMRCGNPMIWVLMAQDGVSTLQVSNTLQAKRNLIAPGTQRCTYSPLDENGMCKRAKAIDETQEPLLNAPF